MADKKISALTAATTPLAGTEVLPIVQSGSTVKVANNDLRPKQIQSNATSGVLQVVGPAAASTRVMTTPDANFTAARTDAAQTFTGTQTFSTGIVSAKTISSTGTLLAVPTGTATTFITLPSNTTTYGINVYLVSIGCIGNAASTYAEVAIAKVCYNTCQVSVISDGTSVTISASGLDIQVTQTSGANQDIEWIVTQLG